MTHWQAMNEVEIAIARLRVALTVEGTTLYEQRMIKGALNKLVKITE